MGARSTIAYQKATLTVGATGIHLPKRRTAPRRLTAINTVEIYGKVGLDMPLSPKLAVWYDVDKIKGAYFGGARIEPQDCRCAREGPRLGALAGLSAGQGDSRRPDIPERVVQLRG